MAMLKYTIREVEATHPLLFKMALRHHQNLFWRRATRGQSLQTADAETDYDEVTFTDLFFKSYSWQMKSTLIHELTHVIDEAQRYSYSKEWCAIVGKRISQFHRLSKKHQDPWEADKLAHRCGLPRAYAAEDPVEALACFMEEYLKGYPIDNEVAD